MYLGSTWYGIQCQQLVWSCCGNDFCKQTLHLWVHGVEAGSLSAVEAMFKEGENVRDMDQYQVWLLLDLKCKFPNPSGPPECGKYLH